MTLRLKKNEENYFEYRAGFVARIKINNCLLFIIIFILSLFNHFQYFDYNVLCLNRTFFERNMQFTCSLHVEKGPPQKKAVFCFCRHNICSKL